MAASSTFMSQVASSIRGLSWEDSGSKKSLIQAVISSFKVRCNGEVSRLKKAIDNATKKTITKDQVLWNQEHNESEKRSAFGAEPFPGALTLARRSKGGLRREQGFREYVLL